MESQSMELADLDGGGVTAVDSTFEPSLTAPVDVDSAAPSIRDLIGDVSNATMALKILDTFNPWAVEYSVEKSDVWAVAWLPLTAAFVCGVARTIAVGVFSVMTFAEVWIILQVATTCAPWLIETICQIAGSQGSNRLPKLCNALGWSVAWVIPGGLLVALISPAAPWLGVVLAIAVGGCAGWSLYRKVAMTDRLRGIAATVVGATSEALVMLLLV